MRFLMEPDDGYSFKQNGPILHLHTPIQGRNEDFAKVEGARSEQWRI